MKTRQLILKIVSAVLCALTIVPLFMHFITLRNGANKFRYKFANMSGSTDALVVISRILFIATVVIAMVLLVSLILQFFFKNDILDWIVIGAGVVVMITSSLCFVSTLLYCLSISKIGTYVWFPSFGCYMLVALGIAAPILAFISNKRVETKK